MTAVTPAAAKPRRSLRAYLEPKTLLMLVLGFSSGLPFLLVGNTLGFWLRDEGLSLTIIGYISWVGIAYSLKPLWAPFIDRINAPIFNWLGRRRSWMALSQITVGVAFAAMALVGVRYGIWPLIAFAAVAAFSAATQDIVVDAWRIESAANKDELGLLSSAYQFGFRVALLATDAIILSIAQHFGWPFSYTLFGALMGIGLVATFLSVEPARVESMSAGQTVVPEANDAPGSSRWTDAAGIVLFLASVVLITVTSNALFAQPSLFGVFFALVLIHCAVNAFSKTLRPALIVSTLAGLSLAGTVLIAVIFGFPLAGGTALLVPAGLSLLGAALIAADTVLSDVFVNGNDKNLSLASARGLFAAVAGPFIVFLRAYGGIAVLMLVAISFYRVPDFIMGPMVNPYYHDIGLTKDTVAAVRASVSFIASLGGIAAGGFIALRFGYMRALIIGGILQAAAIAAFSILATSKTNLPVFVAIMAFDSIATSFAGVALVSYMSSLTSMGYTATQYALLASSYTLIGKFLKGFSGQVVDALSKGGDLMHAYAVFFIGCGLAGLPGIALFMVLSRIHARREKVAAAARV